MRDFLYNAGFIHLTNFDEISHGNQAFKRTGNI